MAGGVVAGATRLQLALHCGAAPARRFQLDSRARAPRPAPAARPPSHSTGGSSSRSASRAASAATLRPRAGRRAGRAAGGSIPPSSTIACSCRSSTPSTAACSSPAAAGRWDTHPRARAGGILSRCSFTSSYCLSSSVRLVVAYSFSRPGGELLFDPPRGRLPRLFQRARPPAPPARVPPPHRPAPPIRSAPSPHRARQLVQLGLVGAPCGVRLQQQLELRELLLEPGNEVRSSTRAASAARGLAASCQLPVETLKVVTPRRHARVPPCGARRPATASAPAAPPTHSSAAPRGCTLPGLCPGPRRPPAPRAAWPPAAPPRRAAVGPAPAGRAARSRAPAARR